MAASQNQPHTSATRQEREAYVSRLRENLPAQLLQLPVWLLWAGDLKRKLPIYASGSVRANGIELDSPADRSQLVPFDEAAAAYLRGTYLGIGAALGEVPGEDIILSGIDLDDCYDGDKLDTRAEQILLAAEAYAERSPSGKGLKIFGTGDIGTEKIGSTNDAPGLEIYSSARYFTTTGQRLNGAHLNDLRGAAALARQLLKPAGKPGERTNSARTDSANPILEALKRQGLYLKPGKGGKHLIRCPWESRHSPNEKGERQTSDSEAAYFEPGSVIADNSFARGYFKCQHNHCADRGLKHLQEFLGINSGTEARQAKVRLRTAAEIISQPVHVLWLISKILEKLVLAIVYGDLGTFKSFLALDWALHLAAGKKWLDQFPCRQCASVYVSAEGRGLDKRLRGWGVFHRIDVSNLPFYAVEHLLDLSNEAGVRALTEAIDALGIEPGIIIIDTLSRNCGPLDEDRSSDMAPFLNLLDLKLRVRYGCSVLLVHHVGHSAKDRTRGSYALLSNTDASYRIERPDTREKLIKVSTGRLKDTESHEPIYLAGKVVDLGTLDADGQPESTLVLVPTHSRPIPAKRPTGKQQRALLQHLEAEYLKGNTTWTAAEVIRIAQQPPLSMHRNSARDAWLGLNEAGFIQSTVGGSTLKEPPKP